MEMEEEWNAEALCAIEEDELPFMVMMGELIDYEDDWIIDSRCSNHMTDDQRDAIEEGWTLVKEVLSNLDNIEEILPQKMGEQTVHICLSVDVPEGCW